jgi:hypothetical protein
MCWIHPTHAWSLAQLHSRKSRQANHAGTRRRLRRAAHMWARIAERERLHPDGVEPWPIEKTIALLTGKDRRPHV